MQVSPKSKPRASQVKSSNFIWKYQQAVTLQKHTILGYQKRQSPNIAGHLLTENTLLLRRITLLNNKKYKYNYEKFIIKTYKLRKKNRN